MISNDLVRIEEAITGNLGLQVKATIEDSPEGREVTLSPVGLHHSEGFEISIRLGWKRVISRFVPGPFSLDLIRSMGAAESESKRLFSLACHQILDVGAQITMDVNGNPVDPTEPSRWPENWEMFMLKLTSPYIEADTDLSLSPKAVSHVVEWGMKVLSLAMFLLPVMIDDGGVSEEVPVEGEAEGKVIEKLSRRFERSNRNRAACIAIHGTNCIVCGFNFSESFGETGLGFIHVHHRIPLSRLDGSYSMNPATDLAPICPNCHAMIHRRSPPFSIAELRNIFYDARK